MSAGRINLFAVGVAAVVYWLLGAVWFTLLMRPWLAGIGKTQEQLRQAGSPALAYLVALVSNLLMAYVIAWVVVAMGQTALGGMKVAALLWLGLVGAAMATEFIFEARSLQSFAIIAGYPLVGGLIMGAILGAWKRSP